MFLGICVCAHVCMCTRAVCAHTCVCACARCVHTSVQGAGVLHTLALMMVK